MCRRRCHAQLEWLHGCRDEEELVERQRLERVDGDEQMSDMRRIEAAAEDPEPHRLGHGGGRRLCRGVRNTVADLLNASVVRILLPQLRA